jgi:hypothetical protein
MGCCSCKGLLFLQGAAVSVQSTDALVLGP